MQRLAWICGYAMLCKVERPKSKSTLWPKIALAVGLSVIVCALPLAFLNWFTGGWNEDFRGMFPVDAIVLDLDPGQSIAVQGRVVPVSSLTYEVDSGFNGGIDHGRFDTYASIWSEKIELPAGQTWGSTNGGTTELGDQNSIPVRVKGSLPPKLGTFSVSANALLLRELPCSIGVPVGPLTGAPIDLACSLPGIRAKAIRSKRAGPGEVEHLSGKLWVDRKVLGLKSGEQLFIWLEGDLIPFSPTLGYAQIEVDAFHTPFDAYIYAVMQSFPVRLTGKLRRITSYDEALKL